MASPSGNHVPVLPELKYMAVDDPAPAPALRIMGRRRAKPRAFKSTKPPKRKILWAGTAVSEKTKGKRKGPAASAKSAGSDKDGRLVPTVSTIRGDDDTKSKEGLDGVTSFNNFNVLMDGLVADDHELFPGRLRRAYFELCVERKALLHSNLVRKICPALVVGVIKETIIISEGVKAFSFASPTAREHLVAWSKTVEFLEQMGMDIAFLRQRVEELLSNPSAQSHRSTVRGTHGPKTRRPAQK